MRMFFAATLALLGIAGTVATAHSNVVILTERSVRDVLDAYQAAHKAKDTEKAARYLSDDYLIRFTYLKGYTGSSDTRVVTMTRQQAIDEKNKAIARAKTLGLDVRDESTAPSITIKNGKAHAHLRTTGTTIWGGKTIVVVGAMDETLEVRNGRVMITSATATVSSVLINGQATTGTSSKSPPTN